jgi:hypothetical protein
MAAIANYHADCVYLQLEWGNRLPSDNIELLMEINFGEETFRFKFGEVRLGIRHGELGLSLTGGRMPYSNRKLAALLDPAIKTTRQKLLGKKNTKSIEDTLSARASLEVGKTGAGLDAGMKTSQSHDEELVVTDTLDMTLYQVSTKGSEEKPAWSFSSRDGERILIGGIKKQRIGLVSLATPKCQLAATLEVSATDIAIIEVEGLFPAFIKDDTRGIVRAMILKHLRGKTGRIMSKGGLEI